MPSINTCKDSIKNIKNYSADLSFAQSLVTFGSKVVQTSARNTKIHKICEICSTIFSVFYNISRTNFAILLKMLFLAVVMDLVLLA